MKFIKRLIGISSIVAIATTTVLAMLYCIACVISLWSDNAPFMPFSDGTWPVLVLAIVEVFLAFTSARTENMLLGRWAHGEE